MNISALRSHRWTRPTLLVLGAVAGLHLLALLLLGGLRLATGDEVLAGTSVDGVEVSGLDRPQLEAAVDDHAEARLAVPVEVLADDDATSSTRDEIGLRAQTDAMVDEAWSRGRRGFYPALGQQVAARFGAEHDVAFATRLDEVAYETWVGDTVTELSVVPEPARVELALDADGAPAPEVTDATGGSRVDADEVREVVRGVLTDREERSVRVAVEPLPPPTDAADLDTVLADVFVALGDEVRLDNPSAGDDVVLDPDALTRVLEVVFDDDAAPGARLVVTSTAERLTDHLGEQGTQALAADPVDAALDLSGDEAQVTGGTPSIDPDLPAAARRVAQLSLRDADRRDVLPGATQEPELPAADAEQALRASGFSLEEITLANPSNGADVVFDARALERLITAEFAREDDEVVLLLDTDAERLLDELGEDLTEVEAEPVEASVSLAGGEVQRSGGTSGLELDAEAAAEQVVEVATSTDRVGELPGEVLEPEFTAEMAANVRQQVSTFTTRLTPGQSRNTNIRRAVAIIDGDVILPGEQYSLNEGIGERTPDRGFVENGFILDGELTSTVGGGISQVATTFVNAAWFSGIKLMRFQPHSFYFSRYPEGREATLSWNQVDVVVENDSPYPILIATSASDSAVTISFWSSPWAEVETFTSPRYNVRPGRVRPGFTVDFGRTITYPDGTSRDDTYTHTYRPEN